MDSMGFLSFVRGDSFYLNLKKIINPRLAAPVKSREFPLRRAAFDQLPKMKRSGSRTSKMSTDAQDPLEGSLPGIPDPKWHEFLEKEETDLFILGLREEILRKCMDTCFENYLEKQSVAFTVHCAYLAWCKVLNIYYMCRDPGDLEEPEALESWQPDREPEPSQIDSWGSECIKPLEPVMKVSGTEKESEKGTSESTSSRLFYQESPETSSLKSELYGMAEEEYFFGQEPSSPSLDSCPSRRSIFTRTLSMSRRSLPVIDPSALLQGDCTDLTQNRKNESIVKPS